MGISTLRALIVVLLLATVLSITALPQQVSAAPSSPVMVVNGSSHVCSLNAIGNAYCWGNNSSGQLGNGTTTSSGTPLRVSGGVAFSSLTGAAFSTCGLTSGGAAYCWGLNDNGQAGDGTIV